MVLYNLLNSKNISRDISSREKNKKKNIKLANKFGYEYFDGHRDQGYGGYKYDGRWIKVSKRALKRYKIYDGFKILDIGCAKGFFVKDLKDLNNNIEVFGVDISDYALKNCHPDVIENIKFGDARALPFKNNSFDLIFSINVIHNFSKIDCFKAIKEMNRVSKKKENIFIQVDAYKNKKDLDIFKKWVLTAKTCLRPNEWEKLFSEANYKGDFFWTILKEKK